MGRRPVVYTTFCCAYHISSLKNRLVVNIIDRFGNSLSFVFGFYRPLTFRETTDGTTL